MRELEERIRRESYDLGRGIIKVDSFLNHQVEPDLMMAIGREFAQRLGATQPTKVMCVETGGVVPAFTTAAALHVPLIIVRKRRAAGMPRELLTESTLSQTRHQAIDLYASPEFLSPQDRILLIDDFLTNAQMMLALSRLAASGGAQVVGIGVVIEKTYEGGREALADSNVPVEALVRIGKIQDGTIEFVD
ncbi:MAG TPA: xanthine phosphoribosyltransferase [Anaerolineae bacterium]|nr:xanthine phosphoribosyltransferase [Anaerolineae bacterium]